MASRSSIFLLQASFLLAFAIMAFSSSMSHSYYDKSCPEALATIQQEVNAAVRKERRMGASLLRLHFHDCFVNGCDASLLLDGTSSIDTEKNSVANNNSARGFEVIDKIKNKVDKVCGRPVVSCADILAVAARDSVVALGGPRWKVQLGRRDSTTASREKADEDIPSPFMDLDELIENFKKQDLDVKDLVVLSGGHTLGFSQCVFFRDRIHNDSNINEGFAKKLRTICPRNEGDTNLASLDKTPTCFDTNYFNILKKQKGLLHSDQELFNGGETDSLVKFYSSNSKAFWEDFAESMVKMGNIKLLTGEQGQIRSNCRRVNS